jgi:hypothetical protein
MAITFSQGISLGKSISVTTGQLSSGSVYIQGALGHYVNIPKTIASTSTLLGEHTIEFWLYQTQYNSTADVIWSNSAWQPNTINNTTMPSNKQRYILTAGSSGNMQLTFPNYSLTTSVISFTAPPLNTWNHIAINRVAGTVYMYVNGVYKGTAGNSSNNFATPVGSMILGSVNNGFNGYISNFRIVNGRSMYSGTGNTYNTPSFYPPLVPFTAPSTGTSTAGSTSSNINITTVAPGNNKAVTYEFWYYNRADEFGGGIGSLFAGATTWTSGSNGYYFSMGGSSYYGIAGCLSQTFGQVWGQTVNRWNHMAIVVYPGTGLGYVYWNGAGPYVTTTPVTPGSVTSTSITINGNSHSAGFRYTVGAALYTSPFTVPTAPPTTQAGQPNGIGGSAVFSGSNSLTVAGDTNTQIGTKDFTWEAWIYTTGNTGTYQTIMSQRSGVSATQGSITFGSTYVLGLQYQYLSVAANSVFTFGTNNFTIEFWLNQTVRGTFDRAFIYDASPVANSTGTFYFTIGSSQFGVSYGTGAAVVSLVTSVNNLPPLNTWNHFAIVRNGNVLTWYMNGVAMATGAYNYNILAQVGAMQINVSSGTNFTTVGHITNFRVVNSVAVYTANFTPPTSPLTAVFGTQLLLLANSAATLLTDSSVNNLTVTNNNSVFWGPATPYYQSNLGYWIGISPGATQVISVWNSNAMLVTAHFPIGANSWHHVALTRQSNTLKLFVDGIYSGLALDSSNVTTQAISIGQDTNGTYNYNFTGNISNVRVTTGQVLYQNTSNPNTYNNSFYPFTPDNLTPLTAGTNTQLLLTMSSSGALLTDSSANAYTVTNNGTVTYSSTNPFTWNTQICMPMASSGTLLTDTSGSAGNTISGGTWSTLAPWTNETQILLRNSSSGTALTDSSPNALTLVNNGQTSGSFDGTTQYLSLSNSAVFDFGTATNFAIEAWVLAATLGSLSSGTNTIFASFPTTLATLYGYYFALAANGALQFVSYVSGTAQTLQTTNNFLAANTWYHVAVTRSGSTYRMFVNGTSATFSGTMNQNVNTNGNNIRIGALNYTGSLGYWPGFISNLRVTSGAALYTGNFTPSTTPLTTSPGSGTVQLLLSLDASPFTDSSANAFSIGNNGTVPIASSGPFSQIIVSAAYDNLSPYASPAPVMDLRAAPATATANTVWLDVSGNGNHGTLFGDNAKMSRVATNGGGIRFTASSSSPAYITTPFALSTTSFTVSVIFSFQSLTGPLVPQGLWDNASVTATRGYLLQLGRSDINQWGMRIGAFASAFYPTIPATGVSTGAILTNVIYELTAVVTPERHSIYANGQLINSGQQGASGHPAAGFAVNTMLFGAVRGADGSAPTGNLGCTLYNMRVYNTGLTQAQIRANYNQYRGNYGI